MPHNASQLQNSALCDTTNLLVSIFQLMITYEYRRCRAMPANYADCRLRNLHSIPCYRDDPRL